MVTSSKKETRPQIVILVGSHLSLSLSPLALRFNLNELGNTSSTIYKHCRAVDSYLDDVSLFSSNGS